jgi:LPXTG-site transpeptidase (sortase) family protein
MKLNLRTFNNFLSVIVVILGLYISVTPFIPELTYMFQDKSPEAKAPYAGELAKSEGSTSTDSIPQDNRIVIPSIQVNEPINEGANIWTINEGGTWRRPGTATPLDENNTVIVGHRFFGNNVSTFYHLDKVEVGHTLALYWEGEEILYEVADKSVVDETAVEIEGPSTRKKLTIYTCDPVWSAANRLVITAYPITEEI